MQNTTLIFLTILSLTFLSACTSDGIIKSSNTNTLSTTNSLATSTSSSSTTEKTMNYRTDHGKHNVTANFLITQDSNGTITAVSTTMASGDHESQRYINRFNSAAKSQIVGKKASSLSLSAVGGASDTTDAFMQAIQSL